MSSSNFVLNSKKTSQESYKMLKNAFNNEIPSCSKTYELLPLKMVRFVYIIHDLGIHQQCPPSDQVSHFHDKICDERKITIHEVTGLRRVLVKCCHKSQHTPSHSAFSIRECLTKHTSTVPNYIHYIWCQVAFFCSPI